MVEYDRRGPVAVITVDRPERRNAINRETALALREAWERFDDDEEAAVGVLTGANGTFSAGADLKAMGLADDPGGLPRLFPDGGLETHHRGHRRPLRGRWHRDGAVV